MIKKNVCVVLTDKAQLSRLVTLLREIKSSSRFNLKVVVAGSALTYKYGNVLKELKKESIRPDVVVPTVVNGTDHVGMAKTAALSMLEASTAFYNLKAHYVVIRGDRFEMLPIAVSAAYLNKIVVHVEGGERTGSIDESVRHAITKMAHLHFVSHEEARRRVIGLGEDRSRVFNVGCLDIDYLAGLKMRKKLDNRIVNGTGTGYEIDLKNDYVVVVLNPVTTEVELARAQVSETLAAVHGLRRQAIWVWPNLDAGSDDMAKKLREWQNQMFGKHMIRFVRYIPPGDFLSVVNNAKVVVGNSSLGIKECGWLGVPVVNIGSRQRKRLKGNNVVDVDFERRSIEAAIEKQLAAGRYRRSNLYGNGRTAKKMVKILAEEEVSVQKSNTF